MLFPKNDSKKGLLHESKILVQQPRLCAPSTAHAVPLADLSKKQVHRTKLMGEQVVWENVPRTRATAMCDWLTLTALRHNGEGFGIYNGIIASPVYGGSGEHSEPMGACNTTFSVFYYRNQ